MRLQPIHQLPNKLLINITWDTGPRSCQKKMKPIFYIIFTGLVILIAFQVYALVNPVIDTPKVNLSSNSPKTNQILPQSKSNRFEPFKRHKVIETVTRRNLFKVDVGGKNNKAPEPVTLKLEKTSLKLTLGGTVTGQKKEDGWAVIQDMETKKQDLYRVDDKIQGATIKSILRNKVILTVNGKDQMLEMNADPSPSHRNRQSMGLGRSSRRPSRSGFPQDRMPPNMENMLNSVKKSDTLFKTRPYFRGGESSGVMIYSIKRDSVAKRLGLRNGDIIQAVNDVDVEDPQDFENSISDNSDMTISILRRGKPKKLIFSGQDKAYTVNDVER